ncbi:MAG: hypothetical protein JSS83_23665 [Cyanobacteria bacterium SZAS LIN-3]|nr:hypothetical protein [Cyanobacteria bacterium SZAS LIN-3]MBS2007665.1 hypothetical protein [Cyanobacteria bacterium SZAS TMP-1]
MLNILLNRYYLTNASRAVNSGPLAETQAKVQALLSNSHFGEQPASDTGKSARGKEQHAGRLRELDGLWKRHLVHEEGRDLNRGEELKDCSGSFCKKH